ncbi:MAG: bifunctional aspartate carbamoyltransferase catalytic subunit/aspartate carbamoyltransferase regulatory subunit, partial [Spirochaetae bacterium HGW-Spirochaetae-7]
RAALMAMLSGVIGDDFEGEGLSVRQADEDFVVEAPTSSAHKPEYKVGIKPVDSGLVIDHIASGAPVEEIWNRIDKIRRVLGLNLRSSHGVYHTSSGAFKGIISVPDLESFGEKELKRLGAVSPGCTLNLVQDHRVARKYRLGMPPRIYKFDDIACRNENCVSHPSHEEHVEASFVRKGGTDTFVCRWCEKEHDYPEIWRV